jgi:hypothetical protein
MYRGKCRSQVSLNNLELFITEGHSSKKTNNSISLRQGLEISLYPTPVQSIHITLPNLGPTVTVSSPPRCGFVRASRLALNRTCPILVPWRLDDLRGALKQSPLQQLPGTFYSRIFLRFSSLFRNWETVKHILNKLILNFILGECILLRM